MPTIGGDVAGHIALIPCSPARTVNVVVFIEVGSWRNSGGSAKAREGLTVGFGEPKIKIQRWQVLSVKIHLLWICSAAKGNLEIWDSGEKDCLRNEFAPVFQVTHTMLPPESLRHSEALTAGSGFWIVFEVWAQSRFRMHTHKAAATMGKSITMYRYIYTYKWGSLIFPMSFLIAHC